MLSSRLGALNALSTTVGSSGHNPIMSPEDLCIFLPQALPTQKLSVMTANLWISGVFFLLVLKKCQCTNFTSENLSATI